MGILYMVSTPIGNLEDITFRAVRVLKEVDFIIAEDTRHAQILLKKYEVFSPLLSFHSQSSTTKAREIVRRIKNGENAAYISDAGTPCISDPGYILIREALSLGILIVPVPGASALTAFLSISGLPTDTFIFHGFFPHKKGRQTLLREMVDTKIVHIFYESVHRFSRLLDELLEYLGPERKICIGRELTKLHEDIFRGTVSEAREYFDSHHIKGEFVIGIAPTRF